MGDAVQVTRVIEVGIALGWLEEEMVSFLPRPIWP